MWRFNHAYERTPFKLEGSMQTKQDELKIGIHNLINNFTGSQKNQHHDQTIHPTKKLISMNLFKILWFVTWAEFFDLHGYGGC